MNNFTEKIQNLYNNFQMRIDIEAWIALFEEAFEESSVDEINEKTLEFLMEHFALPVEIWHYFEQIFNWSENQEELMEIYPPAFIEFIVTMVSNTEDHRRYHLFDATQERDFDRFLELLSELNYRLNIEQLEEAENLLDEIEMLDIEHPDYLLEKARLVAFLGNPDEGLSLIDFLIEEYPEDYENYSHALFIRALILSTFDDEQKLRESIHLLEEITTDSKDHYFEKLALSNCYEKQQELKKAYQFILDDILSYFPSDGYILAKMYAITIKLRDTYQEKYEQGIIDDDDLLDLSKYYSICGETEEAYHILVSHPHLVSLEKYHQRMTDVCYNNKDFESTIKHAKLSVEIKPALFTIRTLVEAQMQLRQFDEAIKNIDYAVENIEAKGYDEVGRPLLLEAKARIYYRLKNYESALSVINNAIELNPKIATLFNTKAKILTELTDFNEAFEASEIAQHMMPYTIESYAVQAKIYYQNNYYQEVLEVVQKAQANEIQKGEILVYYHALAMREIALIEDDDIKLKNVLSMLLELEENEAFLELDAASPEDLLYPQLLGQIAYTYWYMDEMTPALSFIERAIQLAEVEEEQDISANWYEFKANVYERMDDLDQAIEVINEAIIKHSHHASLFTKRGYLLGEMEQYDQAIVDLEMALSLNDTDGYTLMSLVYCYNAIESYEKSIDYAQKWIELTNEVDAYGTLAYTYSLADQKEKQHETLLKALEQYPDEEEFLIALGNFYEDKRQFLQGIDIWKQLLNSNSEHIFARTSLAYCQNAIGLNEEALENIGEGIEHLPHVPDFYIWKAIILQDFGRYVEAVEIFEMALELLENNDSYWTADEMYSRIGYVYAQSLNNGKKAIEVFEKAAELNPEEDNHFDMLGYLYEDYEKDKEKAIEAYKQAINLNPTAHPYLNIGNIYQELGEVYLAKKSYEKALELSDPKPNDDHETYAIHGRILIGLKRYDEALVFIDKAKEIAKNDGRNSNGECMCVYSSYAHLHQALGCHEEALKDIERSLSLGDSVYGNALKDKVLAKLGK